MDDLLARTRCFKCGELGHLAKECPQNKETTTKFRDFLQWHGSHQFPAMSILETGFGLIAAVTILVQVLLEAIVLVFSQDDSTGVSRGDSAGVSRDDCAGVSRNDSRICDSRNESGADDDSRNEPTMYFYSRNGRCVEVDFQRDDETFLDVRKNDVTFLDVQA